LNETGASAAGFMFGEKRMTLFDMSGKSRRHHRALSPASAAPSPSAWQEHGAKVVISSRKQQVCDEVAKAINDKGRQAGRIGDCSEYLDQG